MATSGNKLAGSRIKSNLPGGIQRVADTSTQLGEQFLGQDDPGRVADLGDLEAGVHTMVIT